MQKSGREDSCSEALKNSGAESVVGDLADPQRLFDAMRDLQRVYFLSPFDPYMIQNAVAARAARLDGNRPAVSTLPRLFSFSHWTLNAAERAGGSSTLSTP